MNLDNETMSFVKLLCLISLVQAVTRGKKRYYLDIEITMEYLKEIIEEYDIKYIKVSKSEFESLYREFISMYSVGSKTKYNKKHIYSFHPRLSFEQKTVKAVFMYIAFQNGINQGHKKDSLKQDKAFINIINILQERDMKSDPVVTQTINKTKKRKKNKRKNKY